MHVEDNIDGVHDSDRDDAAVHGVAVATVLRQEVGVDEHE
jgi:hypothetical protein